MLSRQYTNSISSCEKKPQKFICEVMSNFITVRKQIDNDDAVIDNRSCLDENDDWKTNINIDTNHLTHKDASPSDEKR